MSCMVANKETIGAVVFGVLLGEMDQWSNGAVFDRKALSDLGTELWRMNEAAYNACYKDPEAPHLEYKAKTWLNIVPRNIGQAQLIAILKQVQFFKYQCAESAVSETELYQRVEKAAGKLAQMAIERLPEWKAAPWGLKEEMAVEA